MPRKEYCYAIVNEKNGKLLLEDGKLPIYWSKKVAKERCAKFAGFYIETLNMQALTCFILTHPA